MGCGMGLGWGLGGDWGGDGVGTGVGTWMGCARAFPESFRKGIWLSGRKNCGGSLYPSAGAQKVFISGQPMSRRNVTRKKQNQKDNEESIKCP